MLESDPPAAQGDSGELVSLVNIHPHPRGYSTKAGPVVWGAVWPVRGAPQGVGIWTHESTILLPALALIFNSPCFLYFLTFL